MKKTFVALFATLLLTVPPVVAAPAVERSVSIEQDIVHAGRLRLQSQRLAKLWLQAGLGIHAGSATNHIARGVAQFDQTLTELDAYRRKPETRRHLERVAELWADYRTALAKPFNDENLKQLNYLAEDLMLATGRLTMKIEADAEGGGGRLLDLSLRQNMLAQRLARLTLMAQAGDRSSGRLVDIEQARKEFSTALKELRDARENTQATREALELASMQWLFFDRAIGEMKKGNDSHPQHVATTSERIAETLDTVSQHYARGVNTDRYAAAPTGIRRN